MAEIWAVGLATVAVGVYGANQAGKAGDKAAAGGAASLAEQARQFDLTRKDQQPFLDAGYDALRLQNEALKGDFSGFENSPDYLYARDQGIRALDRSAAARGGFMGGGADADRMTFASGLATQNFGNYWDRLAQRAGQGQGSAQNLGALGSQYATNVGNTHQDIANTRASSYMAQANAWGNTAGQLGNLAGMYYGRRG
jgi:hypothetical protein